MKFIYITCKLMYDRMNECKVLKFTIENKIKMISFFFHFHFQVHVVRSALMATFIFLQNLLNELKWRYINMIIINYT